MKKKCKFVFEILSFLVIFCIFFTFMTNSVKANNTNTKRISGLYAEKANSLDTVYIGGSACIVYWQPLTVYEKYGFTSYNYAAYSIQPELYRYMIEEVFEKQNPSLLIIDARPFQYREKDYQPTTASYRNTLSGMHLLSKNRIEFINKYVNSVLGDAELSYYLDIMLYHSSESLDFMTGLKMLFNVNKEKYKGFSYDGEAPIKLVKNDINTKEETVIASETEAIILDLLDYLDTKECNALFVVSPYNETASQKKQFNYIEKIIENRGYDFLDANEYYDSMNLDFDEDFYDKSHVGLTGSSKYTDFLSEYIVENYKLPNHLNDNKYKEWNDLIDDWHIYFASLEELYKEKIENAS